MVLASYCIHGVTTLLDIVYYCDLRLHAPLTLYITLNMPAKVLDDDTKR